MFNYMIAMFGVGMQELLLVLLIVLLIFGSSKLPELARSVGKSIKEFKKGTKEITDVFQDEKK